MMLMNSPFVNKRVRAENGSRVEQLVRSGKSSGEVVNELVSGVSRDLRPTWVKQ